MDTHPGAVGPSEAKPPDLGRVSGKLLLHLLELFAGIPWGVGAEDVVLLGVGGHGAFPCPKKGKHPYYWGWDKIGEGYQWEDLGGRGLKILETDQSWAEY